MTAYSLGSFSISSFTSYGRTVKSKNRMPISFPIYFDTKLNVYFVDNKDFGLYISSPKKESLLRELRQSLEFVWTSYALEKNQNLSKDGVAIKKNLLKIFKEDIN